jgi:hypothetical protein
VFPNSLTNTNLNSEPSRAGIVLEGQNLLKYMYLGCNRVDQGLLG